MRSRIFTIFILTLLATFFACQSHYYVVQNHYDETAINNVQNDDSAVLKIIKPYRDSLQTQMDEVIAVSRVVLKKEQPEGTLGNLVCDLLMKHYADLHPDLCVVNYGGIRINQLEDGYILLGRIYELMPFDNGMQLLYVNGKQLRKLFEKVADKKGWPVSEGVSLQIEKNKLAGAFVNGEEINDAKTYKLIVSDYLANGGDNCDMLKAAPKQDLKELMRNVLIDELRKINKRGDKVVSSISGRITEIK